MKQHGAQQAASTPGFERLMRPQMILFSDDHAVYVGEFRGRHVILKAFFEGAMEEYRAELAAYNALSSVQGLYVPKMLIAGQLSLPVDGRPNIICMHITTELVPGQTLDKVKLNEEEAHAVLYAFQQVQKAVPGFLHGDLRGPNIMILPQDDTKQDDTSVLCRFLDFGSSSLNGTQTQQANEVEQLKSLVGLSEVETRGT